MAGDADVVVAAGDFASMHVGLEMLIDMLVVIETPTILVPGNNETEEALRESCQGWKAATVLHGEWTAIDGGEFYWLGGGVPTTPWELSFDLTAEGAAAKMSEAPVGGVLAVILPLKGHLDGARELGSEELLRAIEQKRTELEIFGYIHEDGGKEARFGPPSLSNAGQ